MQEHQVTKSELLASLSHALDLVEGQPRGHAVRTCLIAMRMAVHAGLSEEQSTQLLYASLLKDAGCSNNSARIQKIFGGDEILCKARVKFVDWSSPLESLKYGFEYTEKGADILTKLKRLASNVAAPGKIMAEVTRARCSRGAAIALELGFDHEVSEAIRCIDEHWDGRGAPEGMRREEIPSLARIVSLAQTLEVFAYAFGVPAAYEMLTERRSKWFEPELVRVAEEFQHDSDFWTKHRSASSYEDIAELTTSAVDSVVDQDIDEICQAYASIIDAKSSFTGEHSTRVTTYAVQIAGHMGMDAERLKVLKRAALLHDIGKLGVPNSILDKPGRLTEEEFDVIKQHPRHSFEILKPISGFERITQIASQHHEKLDGTGYWQGLSAQHLCLETRCLTVADILDALHAKRPYREAMAMPRAFEILDAQAVSAVDPECVHAAKELFLEQELPLAA